MEEQLDGSFKEYLVDGSGNVGSGCSLVIDLTSNKVCIGYMDLTNKQTQVRSGDLAGCFYHIHGGFHRRGCGCLLRHGGG